MKIKLKRSPKTEHEKRRNKSIKRLKKNGAVLLKALNDLVAEVVVVSYSGSGDNGGITGVEVKGFEDRPIDIQQVEVTVTETYSSFKDGAWVDADREMLMSLEDALGEFTDDYIEIAGHSGYYDNAGGHGECTIRVTEKEFTLDHNDTVEDSIYSGYSL